NYGRGLDGELTSSIATAETADWYKMPKIDPFALLTMYYEQPYSQVVQEAVEFASTTIGTPTGRAHQVLIKRSSGRQFHHLRLLFDEQFRPLERTVSLPQKKGELAVNHSVVYTDYRSYPTASGETVWFPARLTYTVYSGKSPSGELTAAVREEFTVHK